MTRVQVPVYADHWAKGDRYGTLVKTYTVEADGTTFTRVSVKLDKSGRIARFTLDDCKIVED